MLCPSGEMTRLKVKMKCRNIDVEKESDFIKITVKRKLDDRIIYSYKTKYEAG